MSCTLERKGRGYDGSQAAPAGRTRLRVDSSRGTSGGDWQVKKLFSFGFLTNFVGLLDRHQISFSRTMLSRFLAADSSHEDYCVIARLQLGEPIAIPELCCTSVCILTYCSEGIHPRSRAHRYRGADARVASMIMPNITQDGMIRPGAGSQRESRSVLGNFTHRANGATARDATRCERIRSSTQ